MSTVDPEPVPTSASPNALGQGAVSQTVLVNGTGFVTGDTTKLSGTGVTVSSTAVVSSTQLSVVVSVSATAATGSRNITVSNKDGGTGTCTGCLTVDAGPSVTGATPTSVARGTANRTCWWVAPTSSNATTEAITITVANPDQGQGSCATCFAVT